MSIVPGQQRLSVGAERRQLDRTGMRVGLADGAPGRQIPRLHCVSSELLTTKVLPSGLNAR